MRPRFAADVADAIAFAQTPRRLKEFAARWGTSRMTTGAALAKLVKDGWLGRSGGMRGRGVRWFSTWHRTSECKSIGLETGALISRKPYGPMVLNALRVPRSANVIADMTGLPIAVVYRTLRDLAAYGFIFPFDRTLTGRGSGTTLWLAAVAIRANRSVSKYEDMKKEDPFFSRRLAAWKQAAKTEE